MTSPAHAARDEGTQSSASTARMAVVHARHLGCKCQGRGDILGIVREALGFCTEPCAPPRLVQDGLAHAAYSPVISYTPD